MCGLARLLKGSGCQVSGSDRSESPGTDEVRSLGISIRIGQEEPLPTDRIDWGVASAAVPQDHPEMRQLRSAGRPVLRYAECVGGWARTRRLLSVAGTHGKTTTTAMTAFLLREAGRNPSFLVGGEVPQLGGSSGVGSSDWFVLESCEYDCSFHRYAPRAAAITNIDEDHLDYFGDRKGVLEAFAGFARRIDPEGLLVFPVGSADLDRIRREAPCRLETFGMDEEEADWHAAGIVQEPAGTRFRLSLQGEDRGEFSLRLCGRHNVGNALAALALCRFAGVSPDALREPLVCFGGAARRFQVRPECSLFTLIEDYGHHPVELAALLDAARQRYPGRTIWLVFQPHQYNRTRRFFSGFVDVLSRADRTIVTDIYGVRESLDHPVAPREVAEAVQGKGVSACHVPLARLAEHLRREAKHSDVVLLVGAGDIWKVGRELVA
jgi:UDP-N-acetylmuramate--alanine ligase